MTSEQRRYERLLERQLRGLPLDPEEALELARHQITLPLARREHAALAELKQWFTQASSESEKHVLTRLERAALVRSRHNSRASLRLLTSDDVTANPSMQRHGSRARWPETLRVRHWKRLAIGLVLASAGAAAFTGGSWGLFARRLTEQEQTSRPGFESAPPNRTQTPTSLPASEPELERPNRSVPLSVVPTLNERTATSQHPRGGARSNATQGHPSPSVLLSQAREALRQNDSNRALARYRELVRRYPQSSEATSVRVTVAQLELQTGSTERALAGFDRYLERGGSLGPEALAGKVQALNALGRHARAKRAMREYITRFPNEVHSKGYQRALEQ